jgi:hypothetical protein
MGWRLLDLGTVAQLSKMAKLLISTSTFATQDNARYSLADLLVLSGYIIGVIEDVCRHISPQWDYHW